MLKQLQPANKCTGALLIEVLVATVIVAVSIAASVRAVTESIAYLGELIHQQAAVRLSSDIYESLTIIPAAEIRDLPVPASHRCGLADACTTRIWLADQMSAWQQQAATALPHGNAELSAATGKINIRISWQARDGQVLSYLNTYAAG